MSQSSPNKGSTVEGCLCKPDWKLLKRLTIIQNKEKPAHNHFRHHFALWLSANLVSFMFGIGIIEAVVQIYGKEDCYRIGIII